MIKPEFLDDCLIKITTMQPKEFIEYVYSMGSYDGRMEEIRAFGKSIKKVFEPETQTTVESLIDTAEKVRREVSEVELNAGEYTIMDKIREDVG